MEDETAGAAATFKDRHIGPNAADMKEMCQVLGVEHPEEMIQATVPQDIYKPQLDLGGGGAQLSEMEALAKLRDYFEDHPHYRSFYGMGYYPAITPPALQRYVLENPGWYTPYTPYQAEISQGRLELLFLFQTLCCELTGLPVAGASLLDEATAAAEAMCLSYGQRKHKSAQRYLVARSLFPQTVAVVASRARALGIKIELWDMAEYQAGELAERFATGDYFGALLGYPDSTGEIYPMDAMAAEIKRYDGVVGCCTDLLALNLLTPPAELGVDIACGSAQRLGVPMGYGGPHAAFFACVETFKRKLPGRVVGRSMDTSGAPAYRLALQTREQHIKREKATSNICTAQALLAVMAAAYGVYHGRSGLQAIATRVHSGARVVAQWLQEHGLTLMTKQFFDTLRFRYAGEHEYEQAWERAQAIKVHLVFVDQPACAQASYEGQLSVAEAHMPNDFRDVLWAITGVRPTLEDLTRLAAGSPSPALSRDPESYLGQAIFNRPPSELEFMRWLGRLEAKDISLAHSMIPLGSCTMKLNAAAELMPLSWPTLQQAHPCQPVEDVLGYHRVMEDLEGWLAAITQLDHISFQPNSGAQGELAGLMTIMSYLRSCGQGHRRICFVPASAHGTNPASSVMAGMQVVVIRCDDEGNIDLAHLRAMLAQHGADLACLMVTYPSTHGVFEQDIRTICELIHEAGGQVYLDGANLNAGLGICAPGSYGVDVCHLNLHKTFCIPHGGGGPGAGPIAVARHLRHYLPRPPVTLGLQVLAEGELGEGYSVAACAYGSPLILVISWMYIQMMGAAGLRSASQVAILNANYMARRLAPYYPILFKGKGGWVAHECLLDLRAMTQATKITVEDVAKRLMDFGFHAPTMSFPIAGTLMIEPTESEGLEEMNRFIAAMIAIRGEIEAVASGAVTLAESPLKGAPHPWWSLTESWTASYTPKQACFPLPWVKERKFWPATYRIDNAHGDRQFICACGPVEAYEM